MRRGRRVAAEVRRGDRASRSRLPGRHDDRAAARALLRADEIAETAEFFSFGTNDLTQTALRHSRATTPSKFLPRYIERKGILEPRSVRDDRPRGRRRADADRGRARPRERARPQARHLRRARRRPGLDRVLPRGRARLRVVLAVPRADRAARRGAGGPEPRRAPGRNRTAMNRAQAPAYVLLLSACASAPACGLNEAGVAPLENTRASAVMDKTGDWLVTNVLQRIALSLDRGHGSIRSGGRPADHREPPGLGTVPGGQESVRSTSVPRCDHQLRRA
jgi:hypothetical protein